jgi:hypothetical protein
MLVFLGKLAWCMLWIYILSCTPKQTTDYKPIVIELHIFQQTLPRLSVKQMETGYFGFKGSSMFLKYNAEDLILLFIEFFTISNTINSQHKENP